TNLKRLLAYSSLEHVGLICAGVGLNSSLAVFGALLHMGYHALTKPVLFFAAGNIHQACHTVQIRLIGPGLVKVLLWTMVCMSVGHGIQARNAPGLQPLAAAPTVRTHPPGSRNHSREARITRDRERQLCSHLSTPHCCVPRWLWIIRDSKVVSPFLNRRNR